MKQILSITLFFISFISAYGQNPAVLKAGAIFNDYQRDGKNEFLQGYFGGIDARMGVYDNSYVKLGAAIGRMHSLHKKDFLEDEDFFTVKEGIVFARFFAGLEFRAFNYYSKINARLSTGISLMTTLDSEGSSTNGFSQSSFTIPIGLGFDIGIISLDITLEPGITHWMNTIEDTKPFISTFSIGLQF